MNEQLWVKFAENNTELLNVNSEMYVNYLI